MRKSKDTAAHYFLGFPLDPSLTINLKNVSVIGDRDIGCQIDSPYFTLKRTFKKTDFGGTYVEDLKVGETVVHNDDIKNGKFLKIVNQFNQCVKDIAVAYVLQ